MRLILLKGEAASKISLAFHLESNNLETILTTTMHHACYWHATEMTTIYVIVS